MYAVKRVVSGGKQGMSACPTAKSEEWEDRWKSK
jgi:hypothetical protein